MEKLNFRKRHLIYV